MTFDSKVTFEKYLSYVSRAASQTLCISRKSWRVFHDRLLLGRCVRGFVMSVLVVLFCSVVLDCRYTPKLIAYWTVQSVLFFNYGCVECKIAHLRSVASLCMLYKVRCIPMHPVYGAYLCRMCQCGLHAVLWSHIGILLRRLAAEHCISAGLLFPSQCPCGTILLILYSMVCDWRVLRVGPTIFLLA